MKAIEVKNLTFFYNKEVPLINDLSFEVYEGDYIAILGNNGSCKSTLAKLLTGILKPISGEIYIYEKKMENNYVNPVSIVFQNPDNQFVATTVEEDIAFGLENKRIERDEMKRLVKEFAKKVHMENYLTFEPSKLSGGQKQRVALAGVLVLDNNILILDEATSMLDPAGKKEITDLINELRKTNPKLTVLNITHEIDSINDVNKVMILEKGNILYFDFKDNVFNLNNDDIKEFLPFGFRLKNHLNNLGFAVKSTKIEGISKELCHLK